MKIKKITNLVYTPSKQSENSKWSGLIAKRNRMLVETDWTQLPDVKLSYNSRAEWQLWREELRNLKRSNYTDSDKFLDKLNKLDKDRDNLLVEYTTSKPFKDVETGKKQLHTLLVQFYINRLNFEFSPNLEEKYQETLDIISIYLKSQTTIDVSSFSGMDALIEYFSNDDINIDLDTTPFPFFTLTKVVKNFSIKDTVLYILKQKQKQFNFSLQEEYNLIHYEHRIDFCNSIDDLLQAKREIELYYGY